MSLVGRLEDLALPDIFQIISLSKKTGTLVVKGKAGTGMVVFRNGQVIQAATDLPQQGLGEFLVEGGVLGRAALEEALEAQRREPSRPLGQILLQMGKVTPRLLEQVLRRQIEETVFQLLGWQDGFFDFALGEMGSPEMGMTELYLEPGISPEYLIMEATRLQDEMRRGEGQRRMSLREMLVEEERAVAQSGKEEALPEREGEEAVAGRGTWGTLSALFTELRFPTATTEIALLILRYASEVVNRAVLFLIRGEEAVGLGQFGVEAPGGSADERVRAIRIPLNEPSVFSQVWQRRQGYAGAIERTYWHERIYEALGGKRPAEACVFPLVIGDTVRFLLYGDNQPAGGPLREVETLEIFINQAGLAMEKAMLEQRLREMEARTQRGA
ncbi:MAG: DUF4388 domain-containing protein [Nitrospirae bacterium]|nr:DUF4388 domain-containing protein [Nitrospirota bacterium]